MIKKTAILWIMALLPFLSFSQESKLGNWLIYFGNKQINPKWNWHHEVQYRNYNLVGDLEQLLLRTGMGYTISENNNILLGYGFIHSQNYGERQSKDVSDEHRIYQQFITKQKIGRLSLQHRYRFEQRFIGSNFKLRFRYFLAFNMPLNNKEMGDKTLYLSAYNEIFIQEKSAVFDRNRLYMGMGYKLNKHIRLELGYMNQFFETQGRDQLNMIVFFQF